MAELSPALKELVERGIISKSTYAHLASIAEDFDQFPQPSKERKFEFISRPTAKQTAALSMDVQEIEQAMRRAGSLTYHDADRAWEALQRVMNRFEDGAVAKDTIFVIGTAYNAYSYSLRRGMDPDRFRTFKLLGKMASPRTIVRVLMTSPPDDADIRLLASLHGSSRPIIVCMCLQYWLVEMECDENGELSTKTSAMEEIR